MKTPPIPLLLLFALPALAQPPPSAPAGLSEQARAPFRARPTGGGVSLGPAGAAPPAWMVASSPGSGRPGAQPPGWRRRGQDRHGRPLPPGMDRLLPALTSRLRTVTLDARPGEQAGPRAVAAPPAPPKPPPAPHDVPACVEAMAQALTHHLARNNPLALRTAGAASLACPELAEGPLLLGLFELFGQRLGQGTPTLDAACAGGGPLAAQACTFAGIRSLLVGDEHAGRDHLEAALRKDPQAWRAQLALATYFHLAGNRPAALRHAQALARVRSLPSGVADLQLLDLRAPAMELLLALTRREHPRCVPCRRAAAAVAVYEAERRSGLAARRWSLRAVELLTEISQEHPQDKEARLVLAHALASTRSYETELAVLEEGLRQGPDPRLEHLLGLTLLDLGRYHKALPYLKQRVAATPQDPEAWMILGTAQRILGLPEAVDSLRKVLQLDPSRGQAAHYLGQVLSTMGYHPEALDAYRRALAQEPSMHQARYGLSQALAALGRSEEANEHSGIYRGQLEALQEQLTEQEKAGNLDSATLEGLAHVEGGRPDQALAAFESVLEELPRQPFASLGKAAVLVSRGQAEQAAPLLGLLLDASGRANRFLRQARTRTPPAQRGAASGRP